jgi:hypothetical protein
MGVLTHGSLLFGFFHNRDEIASRKRDVLQQCSDRLAVIEQVLGLAAMVGLFCRWDIRKFESADGG